MSFCPERCTLGIEFGSTRIKAVLIGPDHAPLAQGDYTWENRLENGVWTYPESEIWPGCRPRMRRWPPTYRPVSASR